MYSATRRPRSLQLPQHQRLDSAPEKGSAQMGFQQIIGILDDAVGGPNAGMARHGPFWRNITRDEFVERKSWEGS
jgi:hypothetical protein